MTPSTLWEQRSRDERASRRVDLATVDDPGCRRLLAVYEAAGVSVAAWDLTTDVGLPALGHGREPSCRPGAEAARGHGRRLPSRPQSSRSPGR